MTYEEFDSIYGDSRGCWELMEAHQEYIIRHNDPSERVICNGDTLLEALEDGYLYEEFREWYIGHYYGELA